MMRWEAERAIIRPSCGGLIGFSEVSMLSAGFSDCGDGFFVDNMVLFSCGLILFASGLVVCCDDKDTTGRGRSNWVMEPTEMEAAAKARATAEPEIVSTSTRSQGYTGGRRSATRSQMTIAVSERRSIPAAMRVFCIQELIIMLGSRIEAEPR